MVGRIDQINKQAREPYDKKSIFCQQVFRDKNGECLHTPINVCFLVVQQVRIQFEGVF